MIQAIHTYAHSYAAVDESHWNWLRENASEIVRISVNVVVNQFDEIDITLSDHDLYATSPYAVFFTENGPVYSTYMNQFKPKRWLKRLKSKLKRFGLSGIPLITDGYYFDNTLYDISEGD